MENAQQLPAWKDCTADEKAQWTDRIVQEVLMPLWSGVRSGNNALTPRRMVADIDILVELREHLNAHQTGNEEFDEWKRQVLEVVEWAPAPEDAPWFYVQTEQDIQREMIIRSLQRWAADVALVDYLQSKGLPSQMFNDINMMMSLRLMYMAVDLFYWNQTRQRLLITPGNTQ